MRAVQDIQNKITVIADDSSVRQGIDDGASSSNNSEIETPVISAIKLKEKRDYKKEFISWVKQKFCTEVYALGIEILPTEIKICEAREENGQWSVIKIDQKNISNGISFENLKKNKALYIESLKELLAKNKIALKSASISLPTSLVMIKNISLPLMSKENLDKATKIPSFWQNLVQLKENLNDYSVFYKIISENPKIKEMDVLFVAVKKTELEHYLQIVRGAGLTPVIVDVGCFSINGLAKLRDAGNDKSQQAFLKIDKSESYFEIVEQGKPYIYDIFVPDGERAYLNEFLDHQNFQQRFIAQISHILSKHEDKTGNKVEKISIVSNETNIGGFVTELTSKFENLDISIADFLSDIRISDNSKKTVESSNKSAWAVATGLATRKLKIFESDNESISESVNLLSGSKDVIKGLRYAFISKIAFLGSLVVCGTFLLTFSIFSYFSYKSNIAELKKFKDLQAIYTTKQAEFKKISETSGELNKLLKVVEQEKPNITDYYNSLQTLGTKTPEGMWLENINFNKEGFVQISGKSFEEKNIILFAKSLSQPEFANTRITAMKSINFDNGAIIKEFSITTETVRK